MLLSATIDLHGSLQRRYTTRSELDTDSRDSFSSKFSYRYSYRLETKQSARTCASTPASNPIFVSTLANTPTNSLKEFPILGSCTRSPGIPSLGPPFSLALVHSRLQTRHSGTSNLSLRINEMCTSGPSLSGPVLRDTARLSQRYPLARYRETISAIPPYCALWGFWCLNIFGVSTWPIRCDTLSPFSERFPLGEHAKWSCDTPPPQKGYLSDTCAIP